MLVTLALNLDISSSIHGKKSIDPRIVDCCMVLAWNRACALLFGLVVCSEGLAVWVAPDILDTSQHPAYLTVLCMIPSWRILMKILLQGVLVHEHDDGGTIEGVQSSANRKSLEQPFRYRKGQKVLVHFLQSR